MKKTIILHRVTYGSQKTPFKKREYVGDYGSPVGTKKEWQEWSKGKDVKLIFKESKKLILVNQPYAKAGIQL